MESREKKMSEPNDDEEEDVDPKSEDAEPSLDSLGRPVSGSRRTQGANIGLGQMIINMRIQRKALFRVLAPSSNLFFTF